MNQEDVKKVYDVLSPMRWIGNDSGYLPMTTRRNDKMSYMEIDARLQAAGRPFDPSATKEMLMQELQTIQELPMMDPQGLETEIENELKKQEELVQKIEEVTKGMNEKIEGIIKAMETAHMKNQIQMMLKKQKQNPQS